MDSWSDEQQLQFQRITEALQQQGANRPCPMCGFEAGMGIEGYGLQQVFGDPEGEETLGAIATVIVTCGNCGLISQFALPDDENE